MIATRNLTTGQTSETFPGQYEGEEVLIFVRRHWMAFVGWVLLLIIMLTIPVIVLVSILALQGPGFFHGTNLIYAALGTSTYLLITTAVFLTTWIEHYLDVAIITSERLVHISQIGLFNRHVAELSLLRVQDVSASVKGYFQSVFQYGQVEVESAGDTPNFVMPFAPKPHVVANTILALHDRLMKQESTPAGAVLEPGEEEAAIVRPIRDALEREVPNVSPPHDFHHADFEEDLLSRKSQLESQPTARSAPEPAPEPTLSSPNRLPPAHRPGKPVKSRDEGELEEGTSIDL